MVIEITDGKDVEGQTIGVGQRTNSTTQLWKIIYTKDMNATRTNGTNAEFGFKIGEPFYLVSRLPMHRVAESPSGNNI